MFGTHKNLESRALLTVDRVMLYKQHIVNCTETLSMYVCQLPIPQMGPDENKVAQQHQLFCSQFTYSHELRLFSKVEQPAQSWEAWARVESAKR